MLLLTKGVCALPHPNTQFCSAVTDPIAFRIGHRASGIEIATGSPCEQTAGEVTDTLSRSIGVPIGRHALPHPMVTRKPVHAVLPPPQLDAPRSAIDRLNSACFCFSLDVKALARALDSELGQPDLSDMSSQRP